MFKRVFGGVVAAACLATACSSANNAAAPAATTTAPTASVPALSIAEIGPPPVLVTEPTPVTQPAPQTNPEAVAPTPVAVPDSCPKDNGDGAKCWRVAVPVDYANPDGPAVDLAVTTIQADPAMWTSPLLALGSFTSNYNWAYDGPAVPLVGHDLVSVDTRGAGRSAPLPSTCTGDDPKFFAQLNAINPGDEVTALLHQCIANAESAQVPLSTVINQTNTARDLVQVRKALGIEQWNVRTSWLGLDAAVRLIDIDPGGVLALLSIEPQIAGTGSSPESAQAAFDAFAADCAAKPACSALGDMNALLGSIESVSSQTKDPATGENIEISKAAALNGIYVALTDPGLVAILPSLMVGLVDGTGVETVASFYVSRKYPTDPALLASLCQRLSYLSDGVDTWGSTDRGPFGFRDLRPNCDAVGPVAQVSVPKPISGDIPVLVLHAAYETSSSQAVAKSIFARMTYMTFIQVPGIANIRSQLQDCYIATATAFFDHPTQTVDAPCLTSPAISSLG